MGGGQAIEDAVVLAKAIAEEVTLDAALARYQAKRLARANRFVKRSYRVGQVAHLRARPLRWLRDRALQRIPLRACPQTKPPFLVCGQAHRESKYALHSSIPLSYKRSLEKLKISVTYEKSGAFYDLSGLPNLALG